MGTTRTWTKGGGAWIAAISVFAGCGAAPAPESAGTVGQQDQDLYALSSAVWRQLSIPVCWENPTPNDATARGWVQAAITNTWQANSDLTFTGWGTCGANDKGIRILIDDSNPLTWGLGRDLDGMVNGMYLNFTYENFSKDYCQPRLEYCDKAVAVHEFGHALGWSHEQNRPDTPAWCTDAPQGTYGDTLVGPWDASSVMNYCNPTWNNGGVLSAGDLTGLRQYYGFPTYVANVKDAVNWGNGVAYFFNGGQYTRFDLANNRTFSGYPLPLSKWNWPGWPDNWNSMDAAVNWGNGKAYFFHGSQYLRYDIANDATDPGYPKALSSTYWPGWPLSWTNVDAAVNWGNGYAYFFRGSEYLKYDIANDKVMPGYPLPIAGHWGAGLWTSGIEYVITGNTPGKAYFFKGKEYLSYDMGTDQVDPGYPKLIVGNWPGVPF